MRTILDLEFSKYLLKISNGTIPTTIIEMISIPNEILITYTNSVESLDTLIKVIFGDIYSCSKNFPTVNDRAILTPTPKKNLVDEINAMLIDKFSEEITRYYSFNEIVDAFEQWIMEYFLNTLTPNWVLPHQLLLKKKKPYHAT